MSQEFLYSIGVKQGCILSPLLFNLFLDDIVKSLETENIGIHLSEAITLFILLYADDIILLAESEEDLQTLLYKLESYCLLNEMKININKTKFMIFETTGCAFTKEINIRIRFQNQILERVFSFKYLGIFFSFNLSFNNQVNHVLTKAKHGAFLFWKYTRRFHTMKVSHLLNLFFVLVVPILLYGTEIWGPWLSKNEIAKLESFYLKHLKRILNVGNSTANCAIYLELGVLPFKALIQQCLLRAIPRFYQINEDFHCLQKLLTIECSWVSFWKETTNICGIPFLLGVLKDYDEESTQMFIKFNLAKIQNFHTNQLFEELSSKSSLKFYKSLKIQSGFERYLDLPISKNKIRALSKFRCGDHALRIRTAAFNRNHQSERNLSCRFCDTLEREDEIHIAFKCCFFQQEHTFFMGKFHQLTGVSNPPCMEPTSLIQLILETDEASMLFADFLSKIFNKISRFETKQKYKVILI